MSRYGIQACIFNNSQVVGWRGWQYTPTRTVDSKGLDGLQYETMHHELSKSPQAELTTLGLKNALALLNDSTDLPQKALDVTHGLVMIGGKYNAANLGYSAGSVHEARTALRGLLFATGIRWSKGGKAELNLKGMFVSTDGLAAAVSESHTLALPAQPVPDYGFTLSSLTLVGDTLTTIDSLELAIDPHYEHEYLLGLPEPADISGAGVRDPLAVTLKVESSDCNLGQGTGTIVAVFKRYASGGGFGTDTVTLTLNTAWSVEESFGGQSNSPATRSLMARTRWDGTNKPLAWALA